MPGHVDRAAEHVREQQDEHDRRHRREDEQVRHPLDLDQVPLGDDRRRRTTPWSWSFGHLRGTSPRFLVGPARFGGVAGEGEEHVVEGRAPQRDVEDATSAASRRRSASIEHAGAALDRRGEPAGCGSSTLTAPFGSSVEDRRAPSASSSERPTITSTRSPPTCAFSSSAVPCAIAWPWSITTISSASRSASSRYCVVSSSVVPAADQFDDDLPHVGPAARVQAGRRLVQEQHRRLGHQRAGQVEPTSHAAGVRLHRTVGRHRPG